MATLSDLRVAVSQRLGLSNNEAEDQPQIDVAINEAVTNILLRTRCNIEPGTFALTAGQGDYVLDPDIMAMVSIYGDGWPWPLERIDLDNMLTRRARGTFSPPVRSYTVAGGLLLVHPTPTEDENLNVYYVPRPDLLVLPTDESGDIPREYHKAIEWYACWQMADSIDDATSSQGQRYEQEYETWIKRIKQFSSRRGGDRSPRLIVGRRDRIGAYIRSRSQDGYW